MYDFYLESGKTLGTSTALLNYVWFKQFKLSFGYSFSTIHTTGYSLIAVQEMNLAYKYPIIFWNTANLIVEAGVNGIYHACRLREGEDTPFDPWIRENTMNNVYGSGLKLTSLVEPIGIDTDSKKGFVTVQSQADFDKKYDECLHS